MKNSQELFEDIKRLNIKDPCLPVSGLGKLTEEVGELAQGINKTTGRKAHKENYAEIVDNIAVECADVIQNVYSLADKFGITLEQICAKMEIQNGKWEKNIDEERIHL